MKKRKKVALLTVTAAVAVALAVGGATYAFFTSSATNTGNSFTAGTLEITSKRSDVPNVGPMFYTDTTHQQGTLATGLWAPGDKVTRGLFLTNTGSLPAKLKTLTVSPADASGHVVSAGAAYTGDMAFADHADVKIWQIQEFDPDGHLIPMTGIDASTMDYLMDDVNQSYADWASQNPGADPANDPNWVALLMEDINKNLLDHLNQIKAAGQGKPGAITDAMVRVVKMYDKKLSDFLDHGVDATSFQISTQPTEATLLGFTVTLDEKTGNDMQGASAYFNFNSYWEQAERPAGI